jgi:Pyruvate/2-oxoacid:ferredoxin oxidoreductase delta subunit
MANENRYERLAAHFDHFIVGAPRTDTLIRLLQVLFPPEEAEVALRMPVMHRMALAEWQAAMPEHAGRLPEILNAMAARGTVQTYRQPGNIVHYALLPSAKGWFDTPFWAGRETEATRCLAPLWLEYRAEAFGAELAKGDMPVFRVVPVGRTLKHDPEILPFEDLRPRIEAQSFSVVSFCPCRQMKAAVGEGCGHSLEVCFSFGSMARYLADQGMGREVSVTETLEIARACEEEGLAHCVENIDGYLGTLCNCCGCCCLFIDTKKRLGFNALAPSSVRAAVDVGTCTACGECLARCPMEAIALPAHGPAKVVEERCIGCGLCAACCPEEAVMLMPREPAEHPPDAATFLERKLK